MIFRDVPTPRFKTMEMREADVEREIALLQIDKHFSPEQKTLRAESLRKQLVRRGPPPDVLFSRRFGLRFCVALSCGVSKMYCRLCSGVLHGFG